MMTKYAFFAGASQKLLAFRIDLLGLPTLDEFDVLISDFYEERCIHLDYLFLCQDDLESLSSNARSYMKDLMMQRYIARLFAPSDALEDLSLQDFQTIRRLFFVEGNVVHLVGLPGLSKGTVILGFHQIM
jgi:hypothetical protein